MLRTAFLAQLLRFRDQAHHWARENNYADWAAVAALLTVIHDHITEGRPLPRI